MNSYIQIIKTSQMNNKQQNGMSSPLRSVRSAKSGKLSPRDIEHPQKVRVLILTQQRLIFQEYYYLKNFTQIIKLDLSYNKISQFPSGFSLKHFSNLQTLFLHYNKFDKLKNLEILAQVPLYDIKSSKIIYLTLFGNPLQQTRARHFCLNILPSLKLMDDKPVKEQEKYEGILNILFNNQNDQVGFPLIEISQKETSIQFLGNVMRQINIAKQFYLKVNPIVIIQRWWRRQYKKKNQYKHFIQQNQIETFNQNHQLNDLIQEHKQSDKVVGVVDSSDLDEILSENIDHTQIKNGKLNNQDQANQQKERMKLYQKKIVNAFQTVYFGLKSLQKLFNQEDSLFCPKQICISNKFRFKQFVKFKNKYLKIYSSPLNNKKYSIKNQKSKKYLSLVFYNNLHYLLELKTKKPASYTRLNNTSSPNSNPLQLPNTYDLVQIDLTKNQKLQLLKQFYFKYKAPTNSQPFPFLFGINLIKISAAIKIQKTWKGYKVRKNFNGLQTVRQQFAAKKIQKWIRNLKFTHRQKFLIESFLFLKNNDAPNIVMKLQTFCSLHQIYEKILEKDLFMKLPFQQSDVEILQDIYQKIDADQQDERMLNLESKRIKTEIILSGFRQPFPSYFQKFIKPYKLNVPKRSDQDIDIKKFKIIDLLIKGAIQVKKMQNFNNSTKKTEYNYVKFQYLNRQDANHRKFLLCLLTYDFRKKGWVAFSSQKETQSKSNLTDLNESIRATSFIKMIYDNDKKEKMFDKIQKYTKEIKKSSEVYWMPIKIRYFEAIVDYSSIIIVGVYKKSFIETDKSDKKMEKDTHELAASRRRFNELNSLRILNNKIALSKFDSQILTPQNIKNRTNKNLVSFSIHLDHQTEIQESIASYGQKRERFLHSLHNGNSHFSLLEDSSLNHSINSYGSTIPLNNNKNHSSIYQKDHQVADLSLQQKKILIQRIKNSHKNKIELITQMKKRKTQMIKRQYKLNAEEEKKLIREGSNSALLQNISRAHIIKKYEKNRFDTKNQLQNFQNRFLRKGNFSIQHQMRQFQKSRSRIINHKNEVLLKQKVPPAKKSARYENIYENGEDTKINQSKIGQARQYLKLKKQTLKTELKEFSIQLSQGFQVVSSLYPEIQEKLQRSDSINLLIQQHKRAKELESNQRRKAMSSATSEKYTKLYEQKKRELIMSQEKQYANYISSDSISQKIQSQLNVKIKELKEGKQKLKVDEKAKILKKKKMLHSVFPEEYYPLQDSQQIGFHLPKINQNNSRNHKV